MDSAQPYGPLLSLIHHGFRFRVDPQRFPPLGPNHIGSISPASIRSTDPRQDDLTESDLQQAQILQYGSIRDVISDIRIERAYRMAIEKALRHNLRSYSPEIPECAVCLLNCARCRW